MVYEVRFNLGASAGIAKTRKILVTVDDKLTKVEATSKALLEASMQLVNEGVHNWSLDKITPMTS